MSNIWVGKAPTVEGNAEQSWWPVLLNTMFPFLVPSVLILVMPSPLWKSFGFWCSSIYWKRDSYTSHEVISLRYLPDLRTNPLSMPKHSPELRIKATAILPGHRVMFYGISCEETLSIVLGIIVEWAPFLAASVTVQQPGVLYSDGHLLLFIDLTFTGILSYMTMDFWRSETEMPP